MTTEAYPAGDMLTTVKSREIQRGMLAEMAGKASAAARHFLATAHLELVLGHDYSEMGATELALRSRLSAASCFWRAGQIEQAEKVFAEAVGAHPEDREAIEQVRDELCRDYSRAS